jgi:predicted hydrocarbon binding protein
MAPPPYAPDVPGLPPVSIFSAPAAPAGTAVHGWRTTSSHARSPEQERSARERAVEMFDRGLELRGAGRYGEALDAWERALALAPDNRVYQHNVQRLRDELGRLRAETPLIDIPSALDDVVAVCVSFRLGIVEASMVTESSVRVVVRECVTCAGTNQSGHAMCRFEAGLVAGAVAAIFKRPARVEETACIGGCGDDACRFEITLG